MKDLLDFFNKLEQDQWSGEVQVTASEGHAFIIIYRGKFLYAYRPFDRALERIENLGWAQIPPQEAVQSLNTWDVFLNTILNLNQENYDRLIRYFKTDRFELFFRIFFWTNIELFPRNFDIELTQHPEFNIYSPKDLKKLVREAQTRTKEWPKIQNRIGSSKRIFISNVPLAESSARAVFNRDAIDKAILEFEEQSGAKTTSQEVGIYSEEQLDLLRLCDGRNSVQDIIRLSPDGEFLVLRRLIELWDRGLIIPKDDYSKVEAKTSDKGSHSFRSLSLLTAVMAGLFYLIHFSSVSQPKQSYVPSYLTQALELYRNVEGRYPVTLSELQQIGVLKNEDLNLYDYELINLKLYSLHLKSVLE